MFKRVLCLALLMLIILVAPAAADLASYEAEPRVFIPSVTSEHIAYLIGHGDHIRPRDNITRAEAATIFFRLVEDDYRLLFFTRENDFPDVPADAWFNNAVSTMTNAALLRGQPDGSFAPHRHITRAEFAVLIARFAGMDGHTYAGAGRFSDSAGHWARHEINLVAAQGWVQGFGDGTFRPQNQITRAEVAAVVNRMLGRLPESYDDLHPDMRRWADNQRTQVRVEVDRPREIHDPELTFAGQPPLRTSTEGIVIHHTHSLGTPWSIHQSHLARDFVGLGYHFLVTQDGTIWMGHGLEYGGRHALNNNHRTIGIAMQGRYDTVDTHVPDAQFDALIWLIRYVQGIYGPLHIYAHRDLNATACPGRHFPMDEVRRGQFRDPTNIIGYHYEWRMPWYYLYIQEATNSHTHEMKEDDIHERWTALLPPRDWSTLERQDPRRIV